jgi:hypothetical protein
MAARDRTPRRLIFPRMTSIARSLVTVWAIWTAQFPHPMRAARHANYTLPLSSKIGKIRVELDVFSGCAEWVDFAGETTLQEAKPIHSGKQSTDLQT